MLLGMLVWDAPLRRTTQVTTRTSLRLQGKYIPLYQCSPYEPYGMYTYNYIEYLMAVHMDQDSTLNWDLLV